MSDASYVSNEVPGVGEVRARRGTATAELAGAVKYWHDKASVAFDEGKESMIPLMLKNKKQAWREGFLSACAAIGLVGIVAGEAIHYWF